MADYGKLLSRIWSDPEFTAMNARSQQLYCLLISYPTRNVAGVLPLTLKRWTNSTADATIDNLTEALIDLAARNFIVIDWDTEEVLIRTYIRNDEVYRQPNLMKSARKFALQMESATLRWALHDELMRLPDHKDADETERVAKTLVKGLTRTPREPIAEPFREPITEPPGVGVTYVGNQNTSTYTGNRTPTPAAAAIPEPRSAAAATPGADLVRAIIPNEHPDAVKTTLRIRASELINAGTPPDTVAAALRLWLTKPNLGPNALAALVSEVIKTSNGHARAAPNGLTAGEAKVVGWAQLGNPTHQQEAIEP